MPPLIREQGKGGVELILLQGTPFCNIDCGYCYLEGRSDRSRMTPETVRRVAGFLREVGAQDGTFRILWHVGEPLVLPTEWYAHAHRTFSEVLSPDRLEFHFQTNGTLLNERWGDFIQGDPRIEVGLSIDGPEFLHDHRRRTRHGKGTHAQAMKGVAVLRQREIPFHCIAVVSDYSLDYPDELHDFFAELKPTVLSLNPEEGDGANQGRGLRGKVSEERYRRFLGRFIDLHLANPAFRVREFQRVESQLKLIDELGSSPLDSNRLNGPGRLLSFDFRGNVHTFAPELLGTELPGVGRWLGNVFQHSWAAILASTGFQRLNNEIDEGRRRCRAECAYYELCGGGSPSNKWFEHGNMVGTETAYCRTVVQAPTDEYVAGLRRAKLREEWSCAGC